MCLQGIRLSGFLETNPEPGQTTLAAFLRPEGGATVKSPPKRRNWNQTFMPREVRECIDKELERVQQESTQSAGQATAALDEDPPPAATAVPGNPSQWLQAAEAANCSLVQDSAASQMPSQLPHGDRAQLQADAVGQATFRQSQGLELSLRDWAPPTASQVLAVSQQPGDPQQRGDRQSSTEGVDTAGEKQTSNVDAKEARLLQNDFGQCKDILDTNAGDKGIPCALWFSSKHATGIFTFM